MNPPTGWKRLLWPLRSRKALIGLAVVAAAYLRDAGVNISDDTMTTILVVGVSAILGIAAEDFALKLPVKPPDQK